MNNEKLIRELRSMLISLDLSPADYQTLCKAIRALGGNP